MAEPSWQETLRLRLVERDAKDGAYAGIIEQCKLLCQSPHQVLTISRSQIGSANQALEGTKCVVAQGNGNGTSQSEQFHSVRRWDGRGVRATVDHFLAPYLL